MRFIVLFVSLILALPAAAQQACSDFELVGFTSTRHSGYEGVLGLTLACQDEFPDSRMCNSVEMMNTVNVPTLPTGVDALVRPVFIPTSATGVERVVYAVDASGIQSGPEFLTCGGWRQGGPSNLALVVNSDGGFMAGSGFCSQATLAVACCAAQPPNLAMIVPVSSPAGRMMLVVLMMDAVGIDTTKSRRVA